MTFFEYYEEDFIKVIFYYCFIELVIFLHQFSSKFIRIPFLYNRRRESSGGGTYGSLSCGQTEGNH